MRANTSSAPGLSSEILTQVELAVRVRPGWIVQIGEGTVGKERETLQLDPKELTPCR
jgi:hypothetical protein